MLDERVAQSATNGRPWLLTGTSIQERESAALDYLLPNGTRHRVYIAQAHDDPVMHNAIGDALVSMRRKLTP